MPALPAASMGRETSTATQAGSQKPGQVLAVVLFLLVRIDAMSGDPRVRVRFVSSLMCYLASR